VIVVEKLDRAAGAGQRRVDGGNVKNGEIH
jgi:hypothetical protein